MFLQIPVCLLSVLPKEVPNSEGHTGTSLLQLQVIPSATTAKHLLHPLLSLYTDNAPLRHQETPRSSEKHLSGQLGRKEAPQNLKPFPALMLLGRKLSASRLSEGVQVGTTQGSTPPAAWQLLALLSALPSCSELSS